MKKARTKKKRGLFFRYYEKNGESGMRGHKTESNYFLFFFFFNEVCRKNWEKENA